MRRILYILMLFCLPLYGFAMQGAVPPATGVASLVHVLDHDEGVSHHHEHDGSVHYDDSDASLEHTQEHSCATQPAGCGLPRSFLFFGKATAQRGSYVAALVPDPVLEGPHRPPAFPLGHDAGGSWYA